MIGVYDPNLTEVVVSVLRDLGSKYVFVLHGSDGLDEIAVMGPTWISKLVDGEI